MVVGGVQGGRRGRGRKERWKGKIGDEGITLRKMRVRSSRRFSTQLSRREEEDKEGTYEREGRLE